MYHSSGIFRISLSVHPPYLFLRACRQEEARCLLALLELWHVALRSFFLARHLVLRDLLLRECGAFLPFLERILIIPLFLFLSQHLENIIHLLRVSFISFTGCSCSFSRKSSKLYQTNHLFYLVSSFYSSGKCHHP